MIKRIAYTAGEPAGIGPDLAILLSQQFNRDQNYQMVTIADPDLIQTRAKQLGVTIKLSEVDLSDTPFPFNKGEIGIVPIKSSCLTTTGQLNTQNAVYVLKTLDHAINGCLKHHYHAMVTGPVQKSVINDAGIAFSGHTEYLAEKTNTHQVVMMLATKGLKVALVTTHIPLAKVAQSISSSLLKTILQIINNDLQTKFGIDKPTILVCGLNPHAGEGGHLGTEEIDTISPTLRELNQQGFNCQGPTSCRYIIYT